MTTAENDGLHLGNWRTAPFSRLGFTRVRELIPSARIAAGPGPAATLARSLTDLSRLVITSPQGGETTLTRFLDDTFTDAFMVLRRGVVVCEWYRTEEASIAPHIVFSVTKSFTAILAGILEADGVLDPDAPVTRYIPEVKGSAYGDATVRHLLDMTVSVRFEEAYLNPDETFLRYREASGWNPRRSDSEATLHTFLPTLAKASHAHGDRIHYRSPNSDLLGWVLERASGQRFAEMMSERIWQPMGAASDAYITVDPAGAARTAGGLCVTIADLARFGELIRCRGVAHGRQVVPGDWIDDTRGGGSVEQWARGDMLSFMSSCRYRSKWYNRVDSGSTMAAGIHGQWLVVDGAGDIVIAKQSSQELPVEDGIDHLHYAAFDAIAAALR